MKTTPLPAYFFTSSLLCGIDAIHGLHQVAQKSSTTILPFRSSAPSGLELIQSLSASAGAGLPCIKLILSRCLLSSNFGASAARDTGGKNKLNIEQSNITASRETLFIPASSNNESPRASQTFGSFLPCLTWAPTLI